MAKKVTNVPNLRFSGFEREWETTELNELGEFLGGGTPSSSNEDFWNGSIPWISSSDLSENDIYSVNISRFITEDAVSNSATKKCLAPVILIVSRVGVGKVAYSEKSLCTSQDFLNIVNFRCNGIFLSYLLSIEMKKAASVVQGTSIKGISSVEIKSKKLYIPQRNEQEKISSFLPLIDERIQTQNKIIEQLETLIKGLCQEIILSQTPNRKLKDCVSCYSSSLTELDVIGEKGTYPVYGATGIIAFISKYQINEDAILIIKDGSGVGKVHYATDKLSVIGTLNYLIVKPTISLKYIFYCLKFFNFKKYKVGSSIPHIYFKDYGKSFIYCPSFDEQQKIEKLLSSIDEKINIESILLKKYEMQKKHLLQNLFI